MAKTNLSHPVADLHGTIGKGAIFRQKKFRDERGRIICEGKQEAYIIKNPRDLKTNPLREAELAHQMLWKEVCKRTSQILQAGQPEGPTELQLAVRQIEHVPTYYTLEEARSLYEDFRRRFQAQLPNTRGKRPDPQAPIDPATRKGKRYSQLPNFIRAILYYSIKSSR